MKQTVKPQGSFFTLSIFRVILFLICLFVFINSHAQNNVLYYKPAPAGFAQGRIAKQLLESDMKFWQKVIEESHVDPYHSISKEAMKKLQESILAGLPDSVTHFEACFALSRLIGSLDEGHLGFASNRVSDSIYMNECIRFPYLLSDANDSGFIVQRDLSEAGRLKSYSRIIEINGTSVQQLYEKYSKLYGGLKPWRQLMVKNSLRKLLFMDGIRSPFNVKAIDGNDTLQFITGGYTLQQADSISKILTAVQAPFQPFSLRFLENNIACLEFNTMDGALRDSFDLFLSRSFEQIKHKGAGGLVIDLRRNGGGDSGLGDRLIEYITDKPYRNVSGMKLRVSSHSKAYAAMMGADDPFRKWKNGKLYEYKVKKLTTPGPNDLRFTGKVAVLIGAATFSSANMLTNAIKDYRLATLIGECTAEPGNDFGEIFSFMLPNTFIVATTAIKQFTRANGDENDFTGIKPDIEVVNTAQDIQQKKDRVMEKAIEFVAAK